MLCQVWCQTRYAYLDWYLSCSSKRRWLSDQHPTYFITLAPMVADTWPELYSLCHPAVTAKCLFSSRCMWFAATFIASAWPCSSMATCTAWTVHVLSVRSCVYVCEFYDFSILGTNWFVFWIFTSILIHWYIRHQCLLFSLSVVCPRPWSWCNSQGCYE